MFVRGNICSRKCHSGNYLSGKCPFRALSVWGTVLRATVLWVTIRGRNVFRELFVGEKSVEEMSVRELFGYRVKPVVSVIRT